MDDAIQTGRVKNDRRRVLQRHLERLERRLQNLEGMSQRYTRMRWGIAVGGLLLTWMVARWFGTAPSWVVLIAVVALFVWVALAHGRVKASMASHALWHRIKSTHLARVVENRPREAQHPSIRPTRALEEPRSPMRMVRLPAIKRAAATTVRLAPSRHPGPVWQPVRIDARPVLPGCPHGLFPAGRGPCGGLH